MNENLNEVEKLEIRPFTRFCMSIGAVPSSYLAGLSIEEQLLWLCSYLEKEVIPAVNNNGEAVEELQNLFTELQTYVNNYFDNLDVQEEINNKLDALVEDGTLKNLIGAYIQPKIDAQNLEIQNFKSSINTQVNNINNKVNLEIQDFKSSINTQVNNINNKVNSVANGSPLVANSTKDMTDTDRIYVNTNDGKWYYYDGDSWEIGGTYQTTGIGKNEITLYNLDSYINNSVDGNYINFDSVTYTTSHYINLSGVETSGNDNFVVLTCSLNGGERLKLKTSMLSDYYGKSDTAIYSLYDNSDNVIEVIHQTLESGLNVFELDVNVPDNCRKIKVNTIANRICYITKATTYKETHKIGYDDLDNILKNKFKLMYNTKLTPTEYVENAYLQVTNTNNVSLSSADGYKVLRILLTPRKKYLLKNLIGFYSQISYAIGSNITRSFSINDVSYNINLPGNFYKSNITGKDTIIDDQYITAPDYATYLYVNISDTNEKLFEIYEANAVDNNLEILSNDILYNKKYVACGDSFTHGDFTGYTGNQDDIYDSELEMYKTYPYWIGKRNNMTVINDGINGSVLALTKTYLDNPSGVNINYKNPFSYQRYKNIPVDTDYITIMFGLNDMGDTYLGTINDNTNETFYGAGNIVLKWLITNRPDAKIGIIVSNAYLSNSYRQALRELAVKWGIGYLDLYNDTSISKTLSGEGMCETAQTIRNSQYYVTQSNHHPNVKAHIIMSHAIEDFLRKL